jgi:Mrp family chromosome partitioning ATPase
LERIQAAIAKARAERAAEAETAADVLRLTRQFGANGPPAGSEAPSPLGEDTVAEISDRKRENRDVARAWAQIAPLHLDNKALRRSHLVAMTGRPGAAEVDAIRTRLLQQLQLKGFLAVGITSPGPGCGKSTVAMNIAFSLGRLPDQRTILADLNLRRPSLGQTLGVEAKHSFASVLSGASPFAEQALRHGDNLALATTHAPVLCPAELLQSRGASDSLGKIRKEYDPTVMLFDLPPFNVHDDAMAFLGQVDCALIVAAAEKTTIKEIDVCEREVGRYTAVLGVILNCCRYMSRSDGYRSTYR